MLQTSRYLLTLFVLFSSVVYTADAQKSDQAQGEPGYGQVDERIELEEVGLIGQSIATSRQRTDVNRTTTYFFEGFDADTMPPTGWTETHTGSHGWRSTGSTDADSGSSAGRCAYHNDDTGDQDSWLISSELDLSSATAPRLTWWNRLERLDWIDEQTQHDVSVSTDSGATWTVVGSGFPLPGELDNRWYERVVTLPAYAGSSSVMIGFHFVANSRDRWFIDDVSVAEAPDYPIYTALGSAIKFAGNVLVSPTTDSLLIRNTGGDTLKISAVTVSGPGFSTVVDSLSMAFGDTAAIAVSFAPTAAQDYTGMLTFATNDSMMLTDTIALSGYGVDAMFFEDFDPHVGFSKELPVRFNKGLPMAGWTIVDGNGDADSIPQHERTWFHDRRFGVNGSGNMRVFIGLKNNYSANEQLTTPSFTVTEPAAVSMDVSRDNNLQPLNVIQVNSDGTRDTLGTVTPGTSYDNYSIVLNDTGTMQIEFDFSPSNNSATYLDLDNVKVAALSDPVYTALRNGSAIDFVDNVLGSTTTDSVLITNTGVDTLDISAVTVSGTGFSTAVDSLSIAVGDTAAIAVSFAPIAAQDYTGMLTFTTNDPTVPTDTITIALSGYGVDAIFFEDFDPPTGSYTELPMDGWTIVDGNGDATSIPEYERTWYHDTLGVDGSGNMEVYMGSRNSYSASEQLTTPSFTVTLPAAVYMDVSWDGNQQPPLNVIQVNSDSTKDTLGIITPGTSYDNYSFVLNDTGTMQIEFYFSPPAGGSTANLHLDNVKVAALPYPVYTALGSAIDFGRYLLGSTTTDSVLITNTGSDTLDISAVTVSGTGFSTAVDSLFIAVGDTAAIAVSFAPSAAQDYTGMLTFTTNDPTVPTDTITIALSGEGVDAVFFEGFDADTMPPTGWTETHTGSNGWQSYNIDADGSGRCARHNNDSGNQESWLKTPELDLSSTMVPRLIWWNRIDFSSSINGVHHVLVSTNSGTSWTVVSSGVPLSDEGDNNWYERIVDLPTYAGSSSVIIAFRYTGNNADAWHIDDVYIVALPSNPVYTALDSAIDFADNLLGSTTTDSVLITNTGTDTLDISAVTVSGTGFSTAVTSLSIAVGDTAAIAVSFAPIVAQDYTSMLTFSTNDSTMLTDTIALSGYGVDAVFFEDFDPPTGSYTDLPMDGWTIVDGNGDATSIPQHWRTWYHDDEGVDSSGNMRVYIGRHNSYFASEQLTTPSFTVTEPAAVSMDVSRGGSQRSLNVIQVNSDSTKDTLGTITPGTSYDNYSFVLNDTGTMQIEFDFSPDSGGSFAYLNLDNVKVAALPYPVYTALGSAIDFGRYLLGSTTTDSVLITNTGSDTLDISAVTVSGTGFSIAVDSLSIAVGDTAAIDVSFAPTAAQDYTGMLTFSTNDSTMLTDTIALSGYGVDAVFFEDFDPYTGSNTDLPMDGWTIVDGNGDADSIPQLYRTWYHDDEGVDGSGNMVASIGSNNSYSASEQLITPSFTVTELSGVYMDVYHHGVFNQESFNVIQVNSDGTKDTLATIMPGTSYNNYTIVLNDTGTMQIEFDFSPVPGSGPIYLKLDNVKVATLPSDPVYTALDSAIDFVDNVLGSTTTDSVLIRNTGVDTLDISAVTVSGTGFSTAVDSLSIAVGDTAAIAVSFAPIAAQDYTGMLTFATNDPTMLTDTIPLSGYGVDAVFFEDFDPPTGFYTDLPMEGWTIVDGNGDATSLPEYQRTWYHDDLGVDSSGNMRVYIGSRNNYSASEQLTTPSFTVTGPSVVSMDLDWDNFPHPLNVIQVNSDSTKDTLGTITPGRLSYDNYTIGLNDTGTMQIEFDFSPDSGGPYCYLDLDNVKIAALPGVTISDSSGFRMMSSPVSGPIYGDLLAELWTQGMTGGDLTSGPANVWTHSDTGWSALTDITPSGDTLTAGQGFLIYVFADTDFDGTDDLPVTLIVSGTENSDSITVPSVGSIADSAWELAGNPYASTIVWDSVTQTNVSATAYVWNNAIADYITWNGNTGGLSNGLIAPFQGFWVQGNGGSGSITIQEADRSSTTGTFYKTMHDSSTGSMSFTITAGAYSDQAYVSFMDNGMAGIDNGDAYKLLPLTSSERVVGIAYADGKSLAINNLPYVMDDALAIPFDVMYLTVEGDTNFVTAEHPVTLTWDLSNLPETVVGLTLTDNITSDTYDLLNPEQDAIIITPVAKGSFSADGSGGVNIYPQLGDSHFTLTVAYSALSTEDESTLPKEFALHRIYPNPFNPSATISFDIPPVETYNNTLLRVYDIKGRRVATLVDAPYKPGTHTVQWHPQNLSSGLYIVQFKAGDKTFNQKITFIK